MRCSQDQRGWVSFWQQGTETSSYCRNKLGACHVHKNPIQCCSCWTLAGLNNLCLLYLCHSHSFLYFSVIQDISALITVKCSPFSSSSFLFFFICICFISELYICPRSYCVCILSAFLIDIFLFFSNIVRMVSPISPLVSTMSLTNSIVTVMVRRT